MSLYYAEKNNESSIELFRKRTIFKGKMVSESMKFANIVDFNFGEKFFYGRTNRLFVPIKYTSFRKEFLSSVSPETPTSAAAFVVDAFEALATQFQKCALAGKISKDDTFLSNLKVHKAYQDPEALYEAHLKTYFESIKSEFLRSNIHVSNFDEFIKEFMFLMKKSVKRFPFTKTAFTKSKYCPLVSSGLAIEVANIDVFNDAQKVEQFLRSKNWGFYVNACNSYGFMVDRNIPWRLVADIASVPMLEYASVYGMNTTNRVLSRGYSTVHRSYFKKFKYYLLSLYNKVRLENFIATKECEGKTVSKTVIPEKYTKEQFDQRYSESYFLNLYCQIRFLEDESHFEKYEIDILIDDTVKLYYSEGISVALNKFERILNKTFDYSGSLSYIKKQQQSRRTTEEP
jgi:hypothetical protein